MGRTTYTPDQLEVIKAAWADEKTASEIAAQFYAKFHIRISRNAVCGMARRLGLAARPNGGNHSPAATAKRLATAKANGVWWGHTKPRLSQPQDKTEPLPKPKPEDITPIGPIGDFEPGMKTCRYPYETPAGLQWCGHPGFPWCSGHQKICYSKPYPVRP